MELLHTYSDGTELVRTTFQHIRDNPTWKGNRILDKEHVQEIIQTLKKNKNPIQYLDSGYYIIKYTELDAAGNIIEMSYLDR